MTRARWIVGVVVAMGCTPLPEAPRLRADAAVAGDTAMDIGADAAVPTDTAMDIGREAGADVVDSGEDGGTDTGIAPAADVGRTDVVDAGAVDAGAVPRFTGGFVSSAVVGAPRLSGGFTWGASVNNPRLEGWLR